MDYFLLILPFFFSVCYSDSHLKVPSTHHILLLQKLGNKELFSSNLSIFDSRNSNIRLNFTFLNSADASRIHQETLTVFCEQIVPHGVSAIISLDKSVHPGLIDLYASYTGIPVIKTFHYSTDSSLVKQELSTILHLEPDPAFSCSVILQILEHYKWRRVAVITQNEHIRTASQLITILRKYEKSEAMFDILLNLTMGSEESEKLRAINLLLALRLTAVVVLLDKNVTLNFMYTAESHGFMKLGCVWILGHPVPEPVHKRLPFPGKVLELKLKNLEDSAAPLPKGVLFAKDSAKILEQAFYNIIVEGKTFSEPPKDCNSTSRWQSGRLLYKHMKNAKVVGHTGLIQFDSIKGTRTAMEYNVLFWFQKNESSVSKTVIARFENSALTILLNGWPPTTAKDLVQSKLDEGVALKITALIQEPYITINKNYEQHKLGETCPLGLPCVGQDGQKSCCSGYCIDLLKLLKRDIGFSAIIYVGQDGNYGAFNQTTGQWSGLIGEVMRGEADIALADLTINEQRSGVVDFTHPYFNAGMGVLVKVFRRDKSSLTAFMNPFAISLWISIVIIIVVALLCMWLLEKFSPYGRRERKSSKQDPNTFKLVEAMWFTLSLVFQTFDTGSRPKSFCCRILALTFAFCMLIVITSYTANLAAFLVVEEEILPLQSKAGIRDLKLQNPPAGFKIATIQESSFERFFQATQDPMLHRIWQHMKHDSVENYSQGIAQLNSGELQAFVGDYPTFENLAAKSHDCSFKVVGKSFFQSGFGIALPKNSSLTKKISDVLMHYEEFDITRKLKTRWFGGKCVVKNSEGAKFARLSMKDLAGLFIAICVGAILSAIFFFSVRYKGSFCESSA